MERALLTVVALVLAYLLDAVVGDPPGFPHPVRLIGSIVEFLDKGARKYFLNPSSLRLAGAVIVIMVAGGSWVIVAILLAVAHHLHPTVELVLQTYIFFTVLAGGDLRRHVLRVDHNLREDKLEQARSSVALLVSRDTSRLNEKGVSRAALESLFENSADGLVAPLFYAAIGGPALAMLFKAVSTMDSMLGYKSEKYIDLGFFAARSDDLLSYIPARLTALFILAAGLTRGTLRCGWQVLKQDRRKHDSPNSAWPEAAAAGVLGLHFGGSDYYSGEVKERLLINAAGREPEAVDIVRGLALFRDTSILAFTVLLLLSYWWKVWEVWPR